MFSEKHQVIRQVKATQYAVRDSGAVNLVTSKKNSLDKGKKNTALQVHVSRKGTTRKKTCTSFDFVLTTGD